MKLKLKSILVFIAATTLLAGCGGNPPSHAAQRVFQGEVAHVEYRLTEGVTRLFDAEGKQLVELKGFTAVPCAEVEIEQISTHEYEVLLTKQPCAPQ